MAAILVNMAVGSSCSILPETKQRVVSMSYVKFMHFASSLMDKARDGKLTLEEISECLRDLSPEHFSDVYVAVKQAQKDGHMTWGECINIASAVVFDHE